MAAKKPMAQRSQTVKGHQKDLARLAGETAGKNTLRKKFKVVNGKQVGSLDRAALASDKAGKKARRTTAASFKKSK